MKFTTVTVTETEVDLMKIPFEEWPKKAKDYVLLLTPAQFDKLKEMPKADRKKYVVDFVIRKQNSAKLIAEDFGL